MYHSLVLPWNSQLDPQERFGTDGAEVPETDRYCSTLYACMLPRRGNRGHLEETGQYYWVRERYRGTSDNTAHRSSTMGCTVIRGPVMQLNFLRSPTPGPGFGGQVAGCISSIFTVILPILFLNFAFSVYSKILFLFILFFDFSIFVFSFLNFPFP